MTLAGLINIVSPDDLKLAAEKQESYLQEQLGKKPGTIVPFETKKRLANLLTS